MMKNDQLEEYISDHRAEMDTEVPALKNWYHIEKELDKKEKKRTAFIWRNRLMKAAAVVLLLGIGGVIGSLLTQQWQTTDLAAQNVELSDEIWEAERYYQEVVDQQLQRLAAYPEQNAAVIADLEDSDVFLKELKSELAKAPKESQEVLLFNIIETYQIKLAILETVLRELETSEVDKTTQHDKQI